MTLALNSNALTTTAELTAQLGGTAPSADILTRLVNTASDTIERYCDRKFQKATVTAEKQPGTGTKFLILDRAPIVSITSISFDGTALSAAEYEIHDADAGIVLSVNTAWEWTAARLDNVCGDPYPGSERKLYSITYVGGWVLPNDGGTRNLPFDLEQACIDLACGIYRAQGSDPRVASESLGAYSVSYAAEGFPPSISRVLDCYRRRI